MNPSWNFEVAQRIADCANSTSAREFRAKMKALDDNDIMCLVEVVDNVLAGTVQVLPIIKRQLRPFASQLRRLSTIRVARKARKELTQVGGAILPALVPVILSVLSSLVSHAIQ